MEACSGQCSDSILISSGNLCNFGERTNTNDNELMPSPISKHADNQQTLTAYDNFCSRRRKTFGSSMRPSSGSNITKLHQITGIQCAKLDAGNENRSCWNQRDNEVDLASQVIDKTERLLMSESVAMEISNWNYNPLDDVSVDDHVNRPFVSDKDSPALPLDCKEERGLISQSTRQCDTVPNSSMQTIFDRERGSLLVRSTVSQPDNEIPEPRTVVFSDFESRDEDLDLEAVLSLTQKLYSQVTDKLSVTVKDVIDLICNEYKVLKLSKTMKNVVRQKLVELIEEEQNSIHLGKEVESSCDEKDSEDGRSACDASTVDSRSDVDYDVKKKEKRNRVTTKKRDTKRKPKTLKTGKVNMELKKSALRIHKEQLRKRRLEELRIRDEELQAVANKQDQERAELIAAKFDTNREDLCVQRFEQRLDLLQRLDQKRINCVVSGSISAVREEMKSVMNLHMAGCGETPEALKLVNSTHTRDIEHETEGDVDSSDDMELEIIGATNKAPCFISKLDSNSNPITSVYSVLSVLDLPDDRSKFKLVHRSPLSSPGRSLDARAVLRQKLLSRQKMMGNNWLARELGYKSQSEHLTDCRTLEERKRESVLKREEERVKVNEQKLKREKLLRLRHDGDFNEETDGNSSCGDKEQEVDKEEFKIAKDLRKREYDDMEQEDDEEEIEIAKKLQQIERDYGDIEQEDDEKEIVIANQFQQTKGEDQLPTSLSEHVQDKLSENEQNRYEMKFGIENEKNLVSSKSSYVDPCDVKYNVQERTEDTEIPVNNGVDSYTDFIATSDDSMSCKDAKDCNGAQLCTQLPSPFTRCSITETLRSDVDNNTALTANARVISTCDNENSDALLDKMSTYVSASLSEKESPAARIKLQASQGSRNVAWRALLEKEADKRKNQSGSSLVEDEADEDEEEQKVLGLEDFGFTVAKKKRENDEDEESYIISDEDLKHVVDDLSDDEGDEEAGAIARKKMETQEEKERHKEMLRRMRDGYDGRRGGIAVGAGTRGIHRFDQLVAADNKGDAKRLGLLNDDELDSDDEGQEQPDNQEEDEAALIETMLKNRFLHRSSADLVTEDFSDDGNDDECDGRSLNGRVNLEDEEEIHQDKLAKVFAKRARMQRILETHGNEEEFSQTKLIDEDSSLKEELMMMKNGLVRKRSQSSQCSSSAFNISVLAPNKKQKAAKISLTTGIFQEGGSLASALQKSRSPKKMRTSFVRSGSGEVTSTNDPFSSNFLKSIPFNHVILHCTSDSHSQFSRSSFSNSNKITTTAVCKPAVGHLTKKTALGSLFSQTVVSSFNRGSR